MTMTTTGLARSQAHPARPARAMAHLRWRSGVGLAAVDTYALVAAGAVTGAGRWAVAGYVAAALAVLAGTGRHRVRVTLRLGDELPRLVGCALLPLPLLVPSAGSRALLAAPAAAIALGTGRAVGYAVLRAARRRGRLAEPTLLVGAGLLGCEIADTLTAHPELGLAPYGFLDARPPARQTSVPWLGAVHALPQLVGAHRIRRVIVCFPRVPDGTLVPVLRALREAPVTVCLVPRLHQLGQVGSADRDEIWGIPLVPLRQPGPLAPALKRALDVVLAGIALAAAVPVLAVAAVASRIASGGPVLFRQARLTSRGRVFRLLKLRTLPPDPDADTAPDTRWAAPEEHCTRLGRLLRASHADELPQLLNVLRGQMSLVGPRPERPYFAAWFAERIPGYADRHRVPAGITGWAQVHGLCGDTSIRERARFDNRYVEDWTLWTDLVILTRTVGVVLRRTGAALWRAGRK